MRLVVITSSDEPMAGVFWASYYDAGGLPPAAVFLLTPRRRRAAWRTPVEGLLLFGPLGSARVWTKVRATHRLLQTSPERIFPGVGRVYRHSTINRGAGFEDLVNMAPDLLVSVGSPEILKTPVLTAASVGAVNVHNGRLPAYRGLFGTFWEAVRDEEWGYTSLHVMDEGIDTGPVLAQGAVALRGRSLVHILGEKKRLGGRLLAWLVGHVEREGALPPPCPPAPGAPAYYGWPSLQAMGLLALRRMRWTMVRPPRTDPPGDLYPPGAAVGDQRV